MLRALQLNSTIVDEVLKTLKFSGAIFGANPIQMNNNHVCIPTNLLYYFVNRVLEESTYIPCIKITMYCMCVDTCKAVEHNTSYNSYQAYIS